MRRLSPFLLGMMLLASPARAAFTSVSRSTVAATVVWNLPFMNLLLATGLSASGAIRDLDVSGSASSDGGVSQVTLYFKKTFDLNVSSVALSYPLLPNTTNFVVPIPPEYVTSEGVLYRAEGRDGSGTTAAYPADGGWLLARVSGYTRMTVGPAGASVVIRDPNPNDGQTVVDIPAGALDRDVEVTVEEMTGVTTTSPQAVPGVTASLARSPVVDTRLSPISAASFRLEPEGTTFKKPVTLRMVYPDGDQDGRLDSDGSDERTLRVLRQTPTGGWTAAGTTVVDTAKNEVRAHLYHFSVYGAFPATSLATADYRPTQKVFTPGSADGFNDTLDFGPLSPGDKVEILDSRGTPVKTLTWPFQWDGRDNGGRLVESGLYIYQFEKDGETASGVFAVAK